MIVKPYKFGLLSATGDDKLFEYPDVWSVEQTTGPERLVIAPSKGHIQLMAELCKTMPEPYGLLYVLLVSRRGKTDGRYQCPMPLSNIDLMDFLARFREYLECDGRHHLWVTAVDNSFNLVYDNHNVIYAYGPLEKFKKHLRLRGMAEIPEVRFPQPHTHHYNVEFDNDESAVVDYLQWKVFPLQENDE